MKIILLPITLVICCLFVSNKASAQGAYDIAPLNALLDTLLPKNIHKQADSFTRFILLKEDTDYVAIETMCKVEWSDIIDNRAAINGGDEGKKVVYGAMQELTANDYMSLLEKVTTLYEAGNFEESFIIAMIFPSNRMRAFAADNFQHVRMTAVINRIKAKTANVTFTTNLDNILNGVTKADFDSFRDGHAGLDAGNIPQITLP